VAKTASDIAARAPTEISFLGGHLALVFIGKRAVFPPELLASVYIDERVLCHNNIQPI
jgi:hypothetical protein